MADATEPTTTLSTHPGPPDDAPVLDLTELMRPQPHGSAQCPTCGKFCTIVDGGRYGDDSWGVVDCPKHGRGEV